MSESSPLALFGDMSKPVNTLIEKISDAFGGFSKPYQIRRVARAEADAELIRATTLIKITELEDRAIHRFVFEEGKKQENIESIISKAVPKVSDQARPENIEDDWIVNFFDKCRLISDEEMQKLWARILSGEANAPGTFSKRTVDLLGSLDKSDAEVFSKLCSFIFVIGNATPLIYDTASAIYTDHGVNFSVLTHLDSIGLIRFDSLSGFVRKGFNQKGFTIYFGEQVWLEFKEPADNTLDVGHVLLTKAGQQLAPICESRPREGFVEYVREKWRGFGYKTEPPTEQAAAVDG